MNFKSKDYEFSVAPSVLIAMFAIICTLLGLGDVTLP